MATHAHSTRTPLLRHTTGSAGLLPAGLPSRSIVAAGGPVTRAIAVMRAAEPGHPRVLSLRQKLAERIEADIALLDALDGDTDREAEDEHGGDIQDQPHDEDSDREASMCGINFGFGCALDLELDESDNEPSLGSLNDIDQSRWGSSGLNDREAGDDNGIADADGLVEQFGGVRHCVGACL